MTERNNENDNENYNNNMNEDSLESIEEQNNIKFSPGGNNQKLGEFFEKFCNFIN